MTNRDPMARAIENALANHTVDRGLERECPEQRRPEVGVPGQDRALLQAKQLVFGRFGERSIGRVGQLFVADPPIERGTAVTQNLAVYLRPELLGAKEDDVEMPAARCDVDKGVSQTALPAGRRVLVQLVDEDDDSLHTELL